jgi:hypothetical protein
MEVRVATKDVESAKLLIVDLVGLFGGEHVSLQADGVVQLQLGRGGNGALVGTLEAVERWLEQTATASAEVCVDDRSYTIERPTENGRMANVEAQPLSIDRLNLAVAEPFAVTARPSGPDGSVRVSRNCESASTVECSAERAPDSPRRGSGGSVLRFASIEPREGLCHCGYSS